MTAALVLLAAPPGAGPETAPGPFETGDELTARNRIDELVFARWSELKVQPARRCSDAVFVRRAYLDVIGTLPTLAETTAFLRDKEPGRRAALVERLLARPEFADYWALKWGDLLRVKSEFPINLWPNAVQAYHRWIHTALRDNLPYDQFARELLTASGSNFRVPQVNFYRALQAHDPTTIADAVALTFMGEQTRHWPEARRAGLAAFFSQVGYKPTAEWKEEIVFHDTGKAPADGATRPVFPDGTPARIAPGQDPRVVLANWLIASENPWFARAVVNRVWFWLLGRGLIHEPDDHRPDNPASHPALLTWLAQELVRAQYDLRHIYRLILNSETYQLSAVPPAVPPPAPAAFAVYPLRRLPAEVLVDALCQITGTTEKYSSAIPEPFTFIPEDQRSIALADGSITSPFLEMFGRPARDTGLESERNDRPSPAQRLHLLNSSHVQRKLEQSTRLRALIQSSRDPRDVTTRLYLTILSRPPTASELASVAAYGKAGGLNSRDAALDLAWALINSSEFLYRH